MDLREQAQRESGELRKDLLAFRWARDRIQHRIMESEGTSRFQDLVEWSGTSAVTGSLDLAIHAMERTLEEFVSVIRRLDEEETDGKQG